MNISDDGPIIMSQRPTIKRICEGFLQILEFHARRQDATDHERKIIKNVRDFIRAELHGLEINTRNEQP